MKRNKEIKKLFAPLFISLLLLPLTTFHSSGCVDAGDPDDTYYSFFAPEVIHNRSESYFFLSADVLYTPSYRYEIDYPEIKPYDYKKENLAEWSAFFGNRISEEYLDLIIYQSSPADLEFIKSEVNGKSNSHSTAYNWGKNTKTAQLNNQIVAALKRENKKMVRQAFDYLLFAKECEPIVTFKKADWWDDKAKNKNATFAFPILEKAEKNFKKEASSSFFKLRYGFQLMRLYYFAEKYKEGADFYTTSIEPPTSSSTIKDRALGYQAACYFNLKDYIHANYIYGLLYNRHPEDCNSLIWSFHPQNESDWNATLALAKNDDEKIALWHLMGIYADPLRAMKGINAINPKSDKMDLLLVRAINIEELYHIPENIAEAKESPYVMKANFDSSRDASPLFDFVKECAEKNDKPDPSLWNIASGYLCYLTGKGQPEAEKYFDKARSLSVTPIQEQQIKLIEVLYRVKNLTRIEANDENALLHDLHWLQYEKADSNLRRRLAVDHIYIDLAKKYLEQKDSLRAELCFHQPVFFNSERNTKRMYEFMTNPNPTLWDNYLLSNYFAQKRDVIEWQAVNLLYKQDMNGALNKLVEDTLAGKGRLEAEPFMIHIKDCHDCDFDSVEKRNQVSKIDFIRMMIGLKNKAVTKTATAKDYFQLGNGFYNMTWYGNARDFFVCHISNDMNYYSSDGPAYYVHEFHPGQPDADFDLYYPPLFNYFDCSSAYKYYQLAYDKASDKEFAAKCCWMMAKCELNEYYNTLSKRPSGREDANFQCGPHVKMLKDKYGDTHYYQEVIKECGYFRTYLSKN